MENNSGINMQNSPENNTKPLPAENFGQPADIRGKEVFDNPDLCAQFLRDYSGIPMLKDVCPEDIEDVAERYHLFREVEFNSDSVKKINMHGKLESGIPLYIVSLTEHKSSVDYDVAMQFLQYMVCIWENWRMEMKQKEQRIYKNKSFRYPPVLPIVYYESKKKWTADMHLKDRIMMADVFAESLPEDPDAGSGSC